MDKSSRKVRKTMRERLLAILRTIIIQLRNPRLVTKGRHMMKIGTEIIIRPKGNLCIGHNVKTQQRVMIAAINGTIEIGDNVSFNRNNIIVCHNEINIGNRCAFGPNVVIYDHDHKFDHNGIVKNEYNTAPIEIGDDCWVGANVTILKGTHIGKCSIIGAGTVVKGIIPPYSIVKSNRELIIKPIDNAGTVN